MRDAYDAEPQVTEALPTVVKAATLPKLKAAAWLLGVPVSALIVIYLVSQVACGQ